VTTGPAVCSGLSDGNNDIGHCTHAGAFHRAGVLSVDAPGLPVVVSGN